MKRSTVYGLVVLAILVVAAVAVVAVTTSTDDRGDTAADGDTGSGPSATSTVTVTVGGYTPSASPTTDTPSGDTTAPTSEATTGATPPTTGDRPTGTGSAGVPSGSMPPPNRDTTRYMGSPPLHQIRAAEKIAAKATIAQYTWTWRDDGPYDWIDRVEKYGTDTYISALRFDEVGVDAAWHRFTRNHVAAHVQVTKAAYDPAKPHSKTMLWVRTKFRVHFTGDDPDKNMPGDYRQVGWVSLTRIGGDWKVSGWIVDHTNRHSNSTGDG